MEYSSALHGCAGSRAVWDKNSGGQALWRPASAHAPLWRKVAYAGWRTAADAGSCFTFPRRHQLWSVGIACTTLGPSQARILMFSTLPTRPCQL
jgi:hypothetical protein